MKPSRPLVNENVAKTKGENIADENRLRKALRDGRTLVGFSNTLAAEGLVDAVGVPSVRSSTPARTRSLIRW